jgi:nucleotide-binding universal stress UspA family protein
MADSEQGHGPAAAGRIVAGIDGSKPSLEALRWAVRQAEVTGAVLEVLTTWEWPSSYGWAAATPEDYDPAGDAAAVLDQALAPLRDRHPGIEVVTTVRQGHPAPALVESSKEADLLVVGSRGHGAFAGMLIGSVSAHCVTNAHCTVVVVRERD